MLILIGGFTIGNGFGAIQEHTDDIFATRVTWRADGMMGMDVSLAYVIGFVLVAIGFLMIILIKDKEIIK